MGVQRCDKKARMLYTFEQSSDAEEMERPKETATLDSLTLSETATKAQLQNAMYVVGA